MNLQPIQSIQMLWPSQLTSGVSGEKSSSEQPTMFSDIFNSLIDNVQETDAVKTEKQYLLATGQLDNPAEWSIAAYKYQVATSLLVQVRDRALDAYSELSRMSI